MKILIINQPLNNRGDEAAHKALVRSLLSKMPEAYFTVLFLQSYSPEGIRQFTVDDDRVVYVDIHPQGDFWKVAEEWIVNGKTSGWNSSPALRSMRNFYEAADFVICAPGGICMGAFQDWWHLFYLKFAQILHKPLIYYGRSFGPFPSDTERSVRFRDESMTLLHYFSFLSIRDKKTEEIAQKIDGLRYHMTTDVAFLESPCKDIPKEIQNAIGEKKYMVFVPNSLVWHPMYKGKVTKETVIEFYCSVIDIIQNRYPELSIVMLPQIFASDDSERDYLFFKEIAAKKQSSNIVVIPDSYSSDIQQTVIAGSELLIGARYHSVVFAINQNVPFVALNYEHKIQGLLSALNKQNCMVNIMETFSDSSSLQNTLEVIERLLPEIRKDGDAQRKSKEIAAECLGRLTDFMSGVN